MEVSVQRHAPAALSPGRKKIINFWDRIPSHRGENRISYLPKTNRSNVRGVSKSFRTESIKKYTLTLVLLDEKQHKGLRRRNSLDWLTK